MVSHNQREYSGKIWIEHQGKPILGKGGAEILRQIEAEQSLSKAAKKLKMSYRYLWGYTRKIEKALGQEIIETHKGGKVGGGGARLTVTGKTLLEEYSRLEDQMNKLLYHLDSSETTALETGVKNQFEAKVIAIVKGAATTRVKLRTSGSEIVTAVMAGEAVKDLNLEIGDRVAATIKSTEIRIRKRTD